MTNILNHTWSRAVPNGIEYREHNSGIVRRRMNYGIGPAPIRTHSTLETAPRRTSDIPELRRFCRPRVALFGGGHISSVNVSSLTTCQQRDGHLSITLNHDTVSSVNVSSLTTCQQRRTPVNHTQSRHCLLRQRLQLDDLSAETDTCQSHSITTPPPPSTSPA